MNAWDVLVRNTSPCLTRPVEEDGPWPFAELDTDAVAALVGGAATPDPSPGAMPVLAPGETPTT